VNDSSCETGDVLIKVGDLRSAVCGHVTYDLSSFAVTRSGARTFSAKGHKQNSQNS